MFFQWLIYIQVKIFFFADQQKITSGTLKLNNAFHFTKKLEAQLTVNYIAPVIIPQGRRESMFLLDIGLKNPFKKEKENSFLMLQIY